MRSARITGARALAAALVCALAVLTHACAVSADVIPPLSGDWVIEQGESVELTGEVAVPASVYIHGTLTLTGCTLSVPGSVHLSGTGTLALSTSTLKLAPGQAVRNAGTVQGTDSLLTTTTGASLASFWTTHYAETTLTRCQFEVMVFDLSWWSTNTFTDCIWVPGSGGQARGGVNTFVGCHLNGFTFCSPSVSYLQDCTFEDADPDTAAQCATIYVYDTTVDLADLRPGYLDYRLIDATNNDFLVEIRNTWIYDFQVWTTGSSQVRVENSALRYLRCTDYSDTELVNSEVGLFTVHMTRQGVGPVNVHVDGFHDGGTPQNTVITSSNSDFRVSFSDTPVDVSWFSLGDNGGPGASDNTVANSTINNLSSVEHSHLQVLDSTLTYLSVGSDYPGATAQLEAERCYIKHVTLGGLATRVALRDSVLCTFNFRTYYEGDAPELAFESSELTPWFPGSVGQLTVGSGFSGARVSGTVTIGPPEDVYVYLWRPGSTVIRSYPLLVQRPDGQPVAGAAVEVTHPPDPTIWWSGATDAEGLAYPEVTFDDTNYGTEFTVTAAQGGASESAPLIFLSSTPIVLTLPVVYQLQWVPPLHDGTTAEAPDGPFNCGRTIPVKFRLLDADGQLVPDEEAEALTATLQVFYEAPCEQGIPTDPGDAEPDTGSEFRYVAEDDLFIYNLSTKDPAWVADYTYGLEVLVDGARVGEVYFSLR